jgi:hypothetical protein
VLGALRKTTEYKMTSEVNVILIINSGSGDKKKRMGGVGWDSWDVTCVNMIAFSGNEDDVRSIEGLLVYEYVFSLNDNEGSISQYK